MDFYSFHNTDYTILLGLFRHLALYIHLALYNTIDTIDGHVGVHGTDNADDRSVRWSHCPNYRIDNRLHIFA